MHARLSPTQRAHSDKTLAMFLSPEAKALRSDPEIAEIQELAMLDHLLSGWKNLESKGIDGRTGKPISKFSLAVDDPVELDRAELVQQQIDEVKHALSGEVDTPGAYRQLSSEDRQYIEGLIRKHIAGTDIGTIGGLGTNQRRYPKDYADESLRDTVIPVSFAPGQKQDRGVKLLLDKAEGVDEDTGVGLYGVDIDAMHREPAAERPDLVAAISNIKMGPTSMNQSDGKRTGIELERSRRKRLQNLQDERFFLENDIPAKQRGGIDSRTNKENLYFGKLMNNLDKEIASTRMASTQLPEEVIVAIENGPGGITIN